MRFQHGSIYTKAQLRMKTRDGGGKRLKKRSVFGSVTDMVHGPAPKPGLLPQVKVPAPATKREKYSGSPFKAVAA